jgi:hypothetical protein
VVGAVSTTATVAIGWTVGVAPALGVVPLQADTASSPPMSRTAVLEVEHLGQGAGRVVMTPA